MMSERINGELELVLKFRGMRYPHTIFKVRSRKLQCGKSGSCGCGCGSGCVCGCRYSLLWLSSLSLSVVAVADRHARSRWSLPLILAERRSCWADVAGPPPPPPATQCCTTQDYDCGYNYTCNKPRPMLPTIAITNHRDDYVNTANRRHRDDHSIHYEQHIATIAVMISKRRAP